VSLTLPLDHLRIEHGQLKLTATRLWSSVTDPTTGAMRPISGLNPFEYTISFREAWYARQVKDGVQVVICHPKLVETGLDLLDFRPSFLRVWIFATHVTASEPPVVEDRTTATGAREISLL